MRSLIGVILLVCVGVAAAQQSPFTAATNYMSLAGYARYLNHVQSGQWTLAR